jgi:hypothetical protein
MHSRKYIRKFESQHIRDIAAIGAKKERRKQRIELVLAGQRQQRP